MNKAIRIVLGYSGTVGVGDVAILEEVGVFEDADATAVIELSLS